MAKRRRMGKSYKKTSRKGGKKRRIRNKQISKYATNAKFGAETKTLDGSYYSAVSAAPNVQIAGTVQTALSLTNVGATSCVNTQVQGTTVANRVGNKCTMKSLKLSFGLVRNAIGIVAAGNTRQKCRLLVIYDRQPNSPTIGNMVLPTIILSLVSNMGAITAGTVDSSIDVNSLERFVVLKDYRFLAPPPNATAAQAAPLVGETGSVSNDIYIDSYIPLKNLETLYNAGVAGSIADIVTGALYICTISDQAPGSAPWDLRGEYRLRFHDN